MKRLALLALLLATVLTSGCCWWGQRPYGCGYGPSYGGGGGCSSGSCGAGMMGPYGNAPMYQQGAMMPVGTTTAAVPLDYVVQ